MIIDWFLRSFWFLKHRVTFHIGILHLRRLLHIWIWNIHRWALGCWAGICVEYLYLSVLSHSYIWFLRNVLTARNLIIIIICLHSSCWFRYRHIISVLIHLPRSNTLIVIINHRGVIESVIIVILMVPIFGLVDMDIWVISDAWNRMSEFNLSLVVVWRYHLFSVDSHINNFLVSLNRWLLLLWRGWNRYLFILLRSFKFPWGHFLLRGVLLRCFTFPFYLIIHKFLRLMDWLLQLLPPILIYVRLINVPRSRTSAEPNHLFHLRLSGPRLLQQQRPTLKVVLLLIRQSESSGRQLVKNIQVVNRIVFRIW